MRVLHVSSGSLFGGVETFLIELARRTIGQGPMESHFALTEEGRLSDELRGLGAKVQMLGRVRMRNPVQLVAARRKLAQLIKDQPFDVAVTHSPWAHAVFARVLRRARVPVAFHLHGHVSGRHWLERLARRKPPAVIIANSQFTAGTAGNIFPGIAVEVVRYAVPGVELEAREDTRRAVREELGADQDVVVIVQTSRLEPWKGHRLHLAALARLRDVPGWSCWIVGGVQRPEENEYREELERTAAEAGIANRVLFVGQRSDVPRILASADIHCQPNVGPEPFGIVFVEAMYFGLPVVTTNLGGAREIVTPATGVLTTPGDPDKLAIALKNLLTDPQRRALLGAAGPARAAELCDPDRQIRQLAAVLAKIRNPARPEFRS